MCRRPCGSYPVTLGAPKSSIISATRSKNEKDHYKVTPHNYYNHSDVLKHFEMQNVQSVGSSIRFPFK